MTDRFEEALLLAVAVAMLAFIPQSTIARGVIIAAIVALLLIAILILRSVSWHKDGITPFDGIMVIGIAITFTYLASLTFLARTTLSALLALLFACFYSLMAVMLFTHRRQPVHAAHPRVKHLRIWKVKRRVEDAEFRRGVEPIPERAPTWEHEVKTHRWYHHFTPRKGRVSHDAHVQPIPAQPPRWYNRTLAQGTARTPRASRAAYAPSSASQRHDASFKRGIEPIHEITPEHLHRLGVYDTEPRKRK